MLREAESHNIKENIPRKSCAMYAQRSSLHKLENAPIRSVSDCECIAPHSPTCIARGALALEPTGIQEATASKLKHNAPNVEARIHAPPCQDEEKTGTVSSRDVASPSERRCA